MGTKPPEQAGTERFDAPGRAVIPGFVDSHGHLVFAGERAEEFAARMEGRPYTAGGIKTTVAGHPRGERRAARRPTSTASSTRHCAPARPPSRPSPATGSRSTTSGARLQVADGLERTFLGAHVVPPEHDADTYVDLVKGEMLDACAPHATWIDVFCEEGAFDGEQTRAILQAGIDKGLTPRVHANQLKHGPGIQIAVRAATPPPPTTAPTRPTTTSTRSRTPTPSPRCSPAPSSPPARHIRTPDDSSTPASPSPSPPTATPAPATRRTSRSASRSPSARCT